MEFDISTIVTKLINKGIVKRHATGYSGEFSIKRDSHLLTKQELDVWLAVLHQGSAHDDQICSDLHKWNFEEMQ